MFDFQQQSVMVGLLRAQRVLETLQDFPGLIGVPAAALKLLDNLTLFPDVFGTAADALFGLGKTTPDASTIHLPSNCDRGQSQVSVLSLPYGHRTAVR